MGCKQFLLFHISTTEELDLTTQKREKTVISMGSLVLSNKRIVTLVTAHRTTMTIGYISCTALGKHHQQSERERWKWRPWISYLSHGHLRPLSLFLIVIILSVILVSPIVVINHILCLILITSLSSLPSMDQIDHTHHLSSLQCLPISQSLVIFLFPDIISFTSPFTLLATQCEFDSCYIHFILHSIIAQEE